MSNMLIINKDDLSEEDINIIKNALTIRNPAYLYQRYTLKIPANRILDNEFFILYAESTFDHTLSVPRALFDDKELTSKLTYKHKHVTIPIEKLKTSKWKATKSLKDFQINPVNMILENKADIITAKCGSGKSVMGTNIIAHTKPPICVVVHQRFLAKQWENEIKEFTKFQKIVHHNNQKISISLTADIVIATVQSLMRLDNSDFYNRFNLVIFDEVHVMGALDFCKVISKFPCRRIGVTATPKRTDGFRTYLWNIGGRIVKAENEQVAAINIIGFDTNLHNRINEKACIVRDSINVPKLINAQYAIPERFELTCNIIRQLLLIGRHIVVLSHRREYATRIFEAINFEDKELLLGRSEIGSQHRQFISATFQLLRVAFNRPRLDTLIHTGAFNAENDVEQTIGRIGRPLEGKPPSIVIDMYENTTGDYGDGYIKWSFNKRLSTYKHLKANIIDTNISSVDQLILEIKRLKGD